MSGAAPGLEELQAILADGQREVEAAIAARDAAPVAPASVEAEAVETAEKAAADAKAHRDALLAEQKQLDQRYEAATGAVTVEDLREVDERRGSLRYDLWTARVSVEKSNLSLYQAQRELLMAYGAATTAGFRAVVDVAEQVQRYRQRLENWRSARDPRYSNLGGDIGAAKLRLDALLLSPPSGSQRVPLARRP